MVTLRREQSAGFNNTGQLESWLDAMCQRMPAIDRDTLRRACELAHQCEQDAAAAGVMRDSSA